VPAPAPGSGGEGDQLDPLSRRLLRAVGVLSVLLLAVIANSLLHGGSGSPFNPNPVAAAAERAGKCPGGRFSMYMVFSSPATTRSITATGVGAFNMKTGRSRAVLEMSLPNTGSIHMVEITDGGSQYVKGDPSAAPALPPGKEWVRTDQDAPQDGETPLDMQAALGTLGSSSAVRLIGRESINGRMTRRYRSETSLATFVDYLREEGKDEVADAYEGIEATSPVGISAESWIDRKNMLRRFRMVMPMPTGSGGPVLTMDLRADIFDYGAEPAIEVPDPATVVDGPLDPPSASSTAFS
jgi:hypothetical protein